MKNDFDKKKLWLSVVPASIIVCTLVWTFITMIIARTQHEDDLMRVLHPKETIERIVLSPSSHPYDQLFDDVLVLTNVSEVALIQDALLESEQNNMPNHPQTSWKCYLTVVTASGTSYATLSGEERVESLCWLYVTSRRKGGIIYGNGTNYRLKAAILEVIKKMPTRKSMLQIDSSI